MLCSLVAGTIVLKEPAASVLGAEVETAGSSEMLVPLYQMIWCHIPENYNLLTVKLV
jgi:hypothetical protein